ncbi:MAG: hypothetical protein HUJ70_00020, partial [Pseudobutyrivibrio sp.]|nr:hypothetical protein [Pseudobutyrivibrio sp.]
MSQFESFIDDFMIPEDIDKVITEGMTEAGKVLKQNVKSTLSSVSSNNHLANKVTVTKPKKCVNGAYILNTTLKGEVQSGMAASTAAFW